MNHGSPAASQPRSLKLYVAAVTFSAAVVIAATFLHADWAVFYGAKPAAVGDLRRAAGRRRGATAEVAAPERRW